MWSHCLFLSSPSEGEERIVFGTNFERFFAVSPPLSVSLPQGERGPQAEEKKPKP
jgi:hypothetical protein